MIDNQWRTCSLNNSYPLTFEVPKRSLLNGSRSPGGGSSIAIIINKYFVILGSHSTEICCHGTCGTYYWKVFRITMHRKKCRAAWITPSNGYEDIRQYCLFPLNDQISLRKDHLRPSTYIINRIFIHHMTAQTRQISGMEAWVLHREKRTSRAVNPYLITLPPLDKWNRRTSGNAGYIEITSHYHVVLRAEGNGKIWRNSADYNMKIHLSADAISGEALRK